MRADVSVISGFMAASSAGLLPIRLATTRTTLDWVRPRQAAAS